MSENKINSVVRGRDNKLFTVGDEILVDGQYEGDKAHKEKITGFFSSDLSGIFVTFTSIGVSKRLGIQHGDTTMHIDGLY